MRSSKYTGVTNVVFGSGVSDYKRPFTLDNQVTYCTRVKHRDPIELPFVALCAELPFYRMFYKFSGNVFLPMY